MGRSYKDEHHDNRDVKRANKHIKKSSENRRNAKSHMRDFAGGVFSEEEFFDMEDHNEHRRSKYPKEY
jgi:hypothetical protein